MQKRTLLAGAALVMTASIVGCASQAMEGAEINSDYTAAGMAPTFQVDPFWPKPLPNQWIIGEAIGVDVDANDNIWMVHRNTADRFVANTQLGAAQDPPLSE